MHCFYLMGIIRTKFKLQLLNQVLYKWFVHSKYSPFISYFFRFNCLPVALFMFAASSHALTDLAEHHFCSLHCSCPSSGSRFVSSSYLPLNLCCSFSFPSEPCLCDSFFNFYQENLESFFFWSNRQLLRSADKDSEGNIFLFNFWITTLVLSVLSILL